MKSRLTVFPTILVILCMAASSYAVEFPARSNPKYKDCSFIEIDELYKDYTQNKVVIVDVRSKLEFDTIHPEGTVHIPLSDPEFDAKVKELATDNPGKKIAFY
jgi:predicted sulfurtransferase